MCVHSSIKWLLGVKLCGLRILLILKWIPRDWCPQRSSEWISDGVSTLNYSVSNETLIGPWICLRGLGGKAGVSADCIVCRDGGQN